MHITVKMALFRNTQYEDRSSSETVKSDWTSRLGANFSVFILHKSVKVRSV